MSRPSAKVATARNTSGANNTKDTTAKAILDASGLLQTLQGHVDDIRGFLQCGICIRPLYEPFTLACGHTFCYSCLTSWFGNGRSSKTCPDCRAAVKSQPAPAYLIRALVQLFTSRAELLEKGETTAEHRKSQREEAEKLDKDKADPNPRTGGLFRGLFKERIPPPRPIIDLEDGVLRCPHCNWELEDGDAGCERCGYRDDAASVTATTESGVGWTESEENSEMTDYMDEVEDGFGDLDDDFEWNDYYDGIPFEGLPLDIHQLHDLHYRNRFRDQFLLRNDPYDWPSSRDTPSSAREDSEEEEDSEDADMGSFIDDDEHDDDEEHDDEEHDDEDRDDDEHDDNEQHYDSQSDRSTVVGGPGYSLRDLHDDIQMGSDVSDSGMSASQEDDDDGSEDAEDEEDQEEAEEEVSSEDDEDEEPVPPNRRRGTQPFNGPSTNVRSALGLFQPMNFRALNRSSFPCRRGSERGQSAQSAGSNAFNAITVNDDSDESPVRPTRRARGRLNCL